MRNTEMTGETPRIGAEDDTIVQLLSPTGERVHHEQYSVDHLDHEMLEGLYRDMVVVRAFDDAATALQRQGELALWAQCKGQEAAQIGSASAFKPQDFIVPSYREHGVTYRRGLPLPELLRLYRGREQGGWDWREYNMTTPTLVIGSQTLHATGYALGILRDGDVGTGDPDRDRAVVTYFGDGATSQGDVSEALVFASAAGAPVVFFCQNNQWAISVPTHTQTRYPIANRGLGFGIPSVRVDGNDVLAVHAVTTAALERARGGGGPTLIEAVTYRMGAHTTSDDPTRYRTQAEEQAWAEKDPIARMRTLLEREGSTPEFFADVEAAGAAVAVAARDFCRSLTPPPVESIFEHVYASPNRQVARDAAAHAEYAAGFEEEAR